MTNIHKLLEYKKSRTIKAKGNKVFLGDNLSVMREFEPEKVDMIYIDPPFCTQSVKKSKAWGKKQAISFNDEWGGGKFIYPMACTQIKGMS